MHKIIFFLLLLSQFLLGCNRFYFPTNYNVPFHQQAKELKVNAEIGNRLPGVSASYSFSKSFYTLLNLGIDAVDDQGIEAGIGYYKHLKNNYMIDVSMASGIGNLDIGSGFQSDESFRFYFQFALGKVKKNVESGFILRSMYVDYKLFSNNFPSQPDFVLFYKPGHASNIMLEPGYMIRAGRKKLKFSFMAGASFPLVVPAVAPPPPDGSYEADTKIRPMPIIQLGLSYAFLLKH